MGQFNIKENINNFIKGDFAVNCRTEELANRFLNYCDKLGIKWCSDKDLLDNNEWDEYRTETSYRCCGKSGMEFGNIKVFKETIGIPVVEFTNSDTYEHIQKPKPPLGVMPKNIYELKRVQDLCKALYERSIFEETDYELMIKWSDELNDRLYGLKGDKLNKEIEDDDESWDFE